MTRSLRCAAVDTLEAGGMELTGSTGAVGDPRG